MDTRFFGNNLITRHDVQDDVRRLLSVAREDAYYKLNAPAGGRLLGALSAAAVVCFGFVTIGSWLR